MELGACFGSYEEFRERLRAHTLPRGYRYGLRSCVSVRWYNRQHGTAVREDVRFMQVKFGCARIQRYKRNKKQQPSLCPAYFVLQYEEDIDQLVINELNNDHVHLDPGCSPSRDTAVTVSAVATELCEQQQRGGTDTGQPAGRVPALHWTTVHPEAVKGEPSASALVRIAEVMKTFLRVDGGLLASVSADSDHGLDRLSFQTSKMKSSFLRFPKSLLLHRALSEGGHVLYAFLVENKEQVGKVVHLSLLKDDTGQSVREMLTVFKEFNPEWQKVQAVFVDISFFHRAVLQELFPSARVLLSVSHAVRLLEKNVKEAEISSSLKQSLMLALQKAACSPSPASLDALSQLAKPVVSPALYDDLQANWFSCESSWCMYAGKGLRSCSTLLDSLDLIMHQAAGLFGQQPSLEASMFHFLECAEFLDAGVLESPNWGFPSAKEDSWSSLLEKPGLHPGTAVEPGPVCGSPALAEHLGPAEQAAAAGTGHVLAMLWASCTELGSWLCWKEWEMVQSSTQLLSPASGSFTVQLLEDTQRVSRDGRSCSCCFHRRYRLPCRHVLAVLQAHRGRVEEAMVSRRWQRRYQHLPAPGDGLLGCGGGVAGDLEGRGERVRSLSLELANLLLQSEGRELEERSATLATILAAWARAPAPGEAAGKEPLPLHCAG
ncbi:zinc finger SWIM domain-containing protein 3 [Athene noctua]|uniref:zinc finger SWIM domain-containing protein 3 n=1 Tax=Athene noctua TaxID=126797 RepID=UPI003EB69E86